MSLLIHPLTSMRPCRPLALSAAALLIGLAGCAANPQAPPELAVAEAALQRASTPVTAAEAPAQLRLASDKLAAARAAEAAGNTERARALSEEAEIDARVAEVHATTARSLRAAKESQDAARALSEELQRKTGH